MEKEENLKSIEVNGRSVSGFIGTIPPEPGVYLMKNASGEIIYIGKAKNLKNRVKSYFLNPSGQGPKVYSLVQQIKTVDFILTRSEIEALILESRMVKKYRPKYNIDLKDDKSFPYIAITISEEYPRLFVTRRHQVRKNLYFGPYTHSVNYIAGVLRHIFRIRDCSYSRMPKLSRPCLSYDMKNCDAPCVGYISKEEYMENIERAKMLLSGRDDFVLKDLEEKMLMYSQKKEFEIAKVYRDQIAQIKKLFEKQAIVSGKVRDADVIGIFQGSFGTVVYVFFIRAGAVTGDSSYTFRSDSLYDPGDAESLVYDFIKLYYSTHDRFIPGLIILPLGIKESALVSQWLSQKNSGKKTDLVFPKRGELKSFVEIANKNAKALYGKSEAEGIRKEKYIEELKVILKLDKAPKVIEAFDVSTILGNYSVGSLVQFVNGAPNRKEYRRFKIKTVSGQDDFSMIGEIVRRRYKRLSESVKAFPDLILVDGGPGQLKAAMQSIESLGIRGSHVVSLAKENEEIYLARSLKPLVLDKKSHALHILMHIRDEAHRFAVGYHRKLRSKGSFS